ncbi:cation:proton antiporter [Salinimicrobium sp. GXAS 041]|uniref:cation:proton antiporter n=1 Tax=Salinimicrobium sp. GXAS 041 TaxID=3400806 RepID=UPI003C74EADA
MDLMLVVFIIALLILISGALFKKFENISITEPLLAMLTAVILGPDGINFLKTDTSQEFYILERTCEFTMAVALMATALRLPKSFFRSHKKTQLPFVILGMVLMWISSSSIFYWIFDFSLAECLLLGAIITPTDPVVAATLVTGDKAKKYLPERVRNTLSFEAGVNDGLAFPLVFFGIFLLNSQSFPLEKWITHTLLYETILCSIIAYGVGHFAGRALHHANKRGFMNEKTVLPFSLSLSLILLSGLDLLGMNGIIAVFIGGLAFRRTISEDEDLKEERVQESMERIFTIPAYFIFGLILPWQEWFSLGWTGFYIVLFIIFLRRIPALLAMIPLLPMFKGKTKDVLLMGWFGPIGVAALYYALHSKEAASFDKAWIIPSLIVFASTVLHGVSSVPFEKLYYRSRKKDE